MTQSWHTGGTVEGNFSYTLDGKYMKATNEAVGGYYITGILNENSILTREANYHPDGGQIFYPFKSGPFILLLALPGDDIKIDNSNNSLEDSILKKIK